MIEVGMPMSPAADHANFAPLSEMNTTPLIDVLLVLLIMFIMAVPLVTHSLDVPLPQPGIEFGPDPVRNKLSLTSDDQILWNGRAVSAGQLTSLLVLTTRLPIEPELQFEPDANASYDLTAKVLDRIESSGISKFDFVGIDRYSYFAR
jgi:biopolymer transport protein ExbD